MYHRIVESTCLFIEELNLNQVKKNWSHAYAEKLTFITTLRQKKLSLQPSKLVHFVTNW
jgi:hypothetical protein